MHVNSFLLTLYFVLPFPRLKKLVKRMILKSEGGEMYSGTLRAIYEKQYNIKIGYGSYGGCFSPLNVPPNVTFGNYCSIAPHIKIFRANHPKDTFTSHPLLYNPALGFVKKDQLDRRPLYIGHDVWIGEGAIILPGVSTIGNGAMIGAGSIVTKDVPPYTVVAGNPAKVIGRRFNEEIIRQLEELQWWLLPKSELLKKIDLFQGIVTSSHE